MAGTGTDARTDEDHPLLAGESLALIERQQAAAQRRLGVNPALFYGPWGVAYLLGFGSIGLPHGCFYATARPGGRGDHRRSVRRRHGHFRGDRDAGRRGLRGPSLEAGVMYGWSWTLGFCALSVVNIGLTRLGLPDDAVTLLWSGSSLLLVGVLYLAAAYFALRSQLRHERHQVYV